MTPNYTYTSENGRDILRLSIRTPLERKEDHCRDFLEPYGVTLEQIRGQRGKAQVSAARWALMYWLVEVCGYDLAKVGRFLNKHHTSVMHGCARHHWFLTGEIRPILSSLQLSTPKARRTTYAML